jgi:predicted dehydrogenase
MKTYAFAGASSRAIGMYARPIHERFAASACVVAVFDINQTRARLLADACGNPPVFDDFDRMLRDTKPDCVIVTTVDRFHHEYIIRALEAGCDAITEKPMTIGAAQCREILAAEKRSGRSVTVTFNYRFAPYTTRVKELLREGVIGAPLSVDFEWILDTRHGADYFRRWHRRMENSGGLLVHKSTHHFDMINWWLDDEPQRVFGLGELRFYGPTREARGERCSTCAHAKTCEFYVDLARDANIKKLYFEAEHEDGYYRDGCVFSDEIDIYDTMSVSTRYKGGALLSYSLNAHSPWEGWRAAINGTGGRMELLMVESGLGSDARSHPIALYNRKGERATIDVPVAGGDHGGGDARLLRRLFGGEQQPDPLGYMAGSWQGAMSILIGIAANQSIATGQSVTIQELL